MPLVQVKSQWSQESCKQVNDRKQSIIVVVSASNYRIRCREHRLVENECLLLCQAGNAAGSNRLTGFACGLIVAVRSSFAA